jgi:hypothetical protein
MSQIKMTVQEWIDRDHQLPTKTPMAGFTMKMESFHREFLKLMYDASAIGRDGKRGGHYRCVDEYSEYIMPKWLILCMFCHYAIIATDDDDPSAWVFMKSDDEIKEMMR